MSNSKIKTIESGTLAAVFGGKYELITNGHSTGQFNMDFDMQRARAVQSGEALPMFRLYGWAPWAASLGAHQKETDISMDKCREYGFDLVRRPTGGRAVLHADEITYSAVLPLPEGRTVHDVYRELHEVLLRSLHALGCTNMEFEKSQPDFRELYKRSAMSTSCFASAARYEISENGRKAVGSAQRLIGNVLLQHGSILLGPGHELLSELVVLANEGMREELREYTRTHSITLSESASRAITFSEAEKCIVETALSK